MGATHRLLTALSLREHHRVLDFGCGSLRAGRLLIPYLLPGHFATTASSSRTCGWWRDAIANQVGADMVADQAAALRRQRGFPLRRVRHRFRLHRRAIDLPHTLRRLAVRGLRNFRGALAPGGLVACTFVDAAPARAASMARTAGVPDLRGLRQRRGRGHVHDAGCLACACRGTAGRSGTSQSRDGGRAFAGRSRTAAARRRGAARS